MNMVHVTYIEASNCGMKLTGMDGKTIEHSVAKYQCDRDYLFNECPRTYYNKLVKDDPDIGLPIDSLVFPDNNAPLLLHQSHERSEAIASQKSA